MNKQIKEIQAQETLRFDPEMLAVLREVHHRALERNRGYAPKAHIFLELMGLVKLKLITEDDRRYLRGEIAALPASGMEPQKDSGDTLRPTRGVVRLPPGKRKEG
jgi:hypothetical protein